MHRPTVRWPGWFHLERRRSARRALKVAISAAGATWIAMALSLPLPWFATVSAVVALEATLQVSMRAARFAVFGATAGAMLGLAVATVAKDQVWAVGLVVAVCLLAFGAAGLDQVGRQAALVASVIVLIPDSTELSTPRFALVRFIETLIGIVVALAVNALILPPRAYKGARRHLGASYAALADMYRLVIAAEATGSRDAAAIIAARRRFRAAMRNIDELWDEAMSERPPIEVLAPHWRATTRRVWEQCTAMDDSVMDAAARGQLTPARAQIIELADQTAAALDCVATGLSGPDPLPQLDDLETARTALLDRVQEMEVHGGDLSFSHALQAFTFVNSMSVIASRLGDLTTEVEQADEPAAP